MAHVTNFIPKLPIFSNLRRITSCPIFSPSNPLLGTKTHLCPSKMPSKTLLFF